MLYSGDQFGSKKDCMTDSLYNVSNYDEFLIPPENYLFLIDNDGDYLRDNDGDYLIEKII
jgi:hypothetical protein